MPLEYVSITFLLLIIGTQCSLAIHYRHHAWCTTLPPSSVEHRWSLWWDRERWPLEINRLTVCKVSEYYDSWVCPPLQKLSWVNQSVDCMQSVCASSLLCFLPFLIASSPMAISGSLLRLRLHLHSILCVCWQQSVLISMRVCIHIQSTPSYVSIGFRRRRQIRLKECQEKEWMNE